MSPEEYLRMHFATQFRMYWLIEFHEYLPHLYTLSQNSMYMHCSQWIQLFHWWYSRCTKFLRDIPFPCCAVGPDKLFCFSTQYVVGTDNTGVVNDAPWATRFPPVCESYQYKSFPVAVRLTDVGPTALAPVPTGSAEVNTSTTTGSEVNNPQAPRIVTVYDPALLYSDRLKSLLLSNRKRSLQNLSMLPIRRYRNLRHHLLNSRSLIRVKATVTSGDKSVQPPPSVTCTL